jgi:hypothetical protein
MAKLIGKYLPDGDADYPEVSISGRPYKLPANTMNVPGGFVVIDADPVPGFDYGAAVRAFGGTWQIGAIDETPLTKEEALALAAGQGMDVTSHSTRDAALKFLNKAGVNVVTESQTAPAEAAPSNQPANKPLAPITDKS